MHAIRKACCRLRVVQVAREAVLVRLVGVLPLHRVREAVRLARLNLLRHLRREVHLDDLRGRAIGGGDNDHNERTGSYNKLQVHTKRG